MKIPFCKYHGTGNDFVLIDNRNDLVTDTSVDWVKHICNRRFGIGADGLILLQKRDTFDFEMVYFNADGNRSSMCGNGGRCIVAFAQRLKMLTTKARFLAVDGSHEATLISSQGNDTWVSLKMSDVPTVEKNPGFYLVNTGSPHYVTFVKDIYSVNVNQEGKKIRNSPRFVKDGINVNFVMQENETFHVRTFERGVEEETLSCGTGVTAVALIVGLLDPEKNKVMLKTPGGNLDVSFERSGTGFNFVFLEGPATFVYDGWIDINI